MKRVDVVFGAWRLQALAVLVAVLAAATMVYGSTAGFTASLANAGNVFTSGVLEMANTKDGLAVMSLSQMVPGESASGTITLENVGDVPGRFYLEPVTVTETLKGFDQRLRLRINEGDRVIYEGVLGGLTERIDLGTWSPAGNQRRGERHTYAFSVTFPGAGSDVDNAYQGARAVVAFDWAAVSQPD